MPELTVVPGEPEHEHAPIPGTIYSAGPSRAGLPADLRYRNHYPVEAVCSCGEPIILKQYLAVGEDGEWQLKDQTRK